MSSRESGIGNRESLVRAASLDDIPQLLELEALFPSDQMSRRSLRRFIAAPNATFLVADSGTELLGNLLMLTRRDSQRARLYSLIVAPQARGLGLAQKLVNAAEAAAMKQTCTRISLEVRSDNLAARALYEKLGYGLEAALPGYYDDGSDGLRLSKPLI